MFPYNTYFCTKYDSKCKQPHSLWSFLPGRQKKICICCLPTVYQDNLLHLNERKRNVLRSFLSWKCYIVLGYYMQTWNWVFYSLMNSDQEERTVGVVSMLFQFQNSFHEQANPHNSKAKKEKKNPHYMSGCIIYT